MMIQKLNSEIITNRIKTYRRAKYLTQSDMAKILNISVPSYSRIENGITPVSLDRLNEIIHALDISLFDLLSPKTIDYEKKASENNLLNDNIEFLKTQMKKQIEQNEKIIELLNECK